MSVTYGESYHTHVFRPDESTMERSGWYAPGYYPPAPPWDAYGNHHYPAPVFYPPTMNCYHHPPQRPQSHYDDHRDSRRSLREDRWSPSPPLSRSSWPSPDRGSRWDSRHRDEYSPSGPSPRANSSNRDDHSPEGNKAKAEALYSLGMAEESPYKGIALLEKALNLLRDGQLLPLENQILRGIIVLQKKLLPANPVKSESGKVECGPDGWPLHFKRYHCFPDLFSDFPGLKKEKDSGCVDGVITGVSFPPLLLVNLDLILKDFQMPK